MPSDVRLSPRAAIQSWLACADRPAKSIGVGSDNSYNPKYTESGSGRYGSNPYAIVTDTVVIERTRISRDRKSIRSIVNADRLVHNHYTVFDLEATNHLREPESERKAKIASDVSLAERLNLHAPFRKFADRDTDDRPQFDNSSRRRKRGRSIISSSLLESAEGSLYEEHSRERPRREESPVRYQDHERSVSGMGTEPYDFVREVPPTLSRSSKRYERKPRHKTTIDKYEVKKDDKEPRKRKRKEKSTGASRQDRKSKRKERSGNALMHTFSAPNVAQDRLTASA